MKKILIIEDETALARVLNAYLKRDHYEVVIANDGLKAIERFDETRPDLVLLDIMIPGLDGWAVLNYIRNKSACPVIMLTALSTTEYKLAGFNQGADDYIAKPFIAEEVVARVSAVLRRSSTMLKKQQVRYYGSLLINYDSHQIFLNGAEVQLAPRDLSVLLLLAEHPNQVFSREKLIELIWGRDYEGSDRAVDLSIKRIRHALKHCNASDVEIKTMHRVGYKFSVNES